VCTVGKTINMDVDYIMAEGWGLQESRTIEFEVLDLLALKKKESRRAGGFSIGRP